MLEALFCVAVLVGLVRAIRVRTRAALLCGSLVAYLFAADTANALAASASGNPLYVFIFMFLGPGASPHRGAGTLPLPALLVECSFLVRGLRIALCSLATWHCFRQSASLNPLQPRAYALDGVALPFAGAAVVDTLESVLLLASWYYATQI